MREQEQFLKVLDRDEAERRFRAAVDLTPRGIEHVALDAALDRVLAVDVVSPLDVPSFDRSNVDGFAVVAEDTFGASEEVPRCLRLGDEVIHTGIVPSSVVRGGEAVAVATGGMVPRGADAVIMIEHVDVREGTLQVRQSAGSSFHSSSDLAWPCGVNVARMNATSTGVVELAATRSNSRPSWFT